MPEVFGCCSSYQECSDINRCLYNENPEYSGCQYRKNLEAGRIFYGKRAGEALSQFHISVRGSNWWSYPAKPEQEKEALRILRSAGITRIPEASGSCTSRVTLKMDDYIYVVYAPGTRLMSETAAQEIAGKLGDIARVEVMTMERRTAIAFLPMVKQENKPVQEPVKKPVYKQMSIFDLMGGLL